MSHPSTPARFLVQSHSFTSNELLEVLNKQDTPYTLGELIKEGPAAGYGLARDGRWYTSENNDEVREAFANKKFTYLMEQYLRNRA